MSFLDKKREEGLDPIKNTNTKQKTTRLGGGFKRYTKKLAKKFVQGNPKKRSTGLA